MGLREVARRQTLPKSLAKQFGDIPTAPALLVPLKLELTPMFSISGWHVERGPPLSDYSSLGEVQTWKDDATSLRVARLCSNFDTIYRVRLDDSLAVDVLPGRKVIVRPIPGLPQITINHFLADQIFPRLVANDGNFVFHAGAVRLRDAAIVLMGESGSGKSTLASSFDRAGQTLMGDDALVASNLDGVPAVHPVYPSLRLFPDSIAALMPGTESGGLVAHYSTKQRIDVEIEGGPDVVPISILAVFALSESDGDRVSISRLSVASTCMALVQNSFALDPSDVEQARLRLEQASAIARSIPAFDIAYPRDYSRLAEVRQAILNQVVKAQ